jgi:hypothetical protein
MTKLGTLKLIGASGQEYSFDVYPSDTDWNDNIACVYYVSKRTRRSNSSGNHTKIYVGETDDIKDRFSSHHKMSCFESHRYNAISILQESGRQKRLDIESDLIDALQPPCND